MSRLDTIRSELLLRQEYSQGYVAGQNFLLVVAVLLLLLILFSVSSDATQLDHTKKLTPLPPKRETTTEKATCRRSYIRRLTTASL